MTNLQIRLIGHDFFTLAHALKANPPQAGIELDRRDASHPDPMR
jgi:hypothetical protein